MDHRSRFRAKSSEIGVCYTLLIHIRDHMSGFLDWKHLDASTIAHLEECLYAASVKQILFAVFGVEQVPVHKQGILTDFHFQNYAFCKRAAFNARQISTFMSIMSDVLSEDARLSTLTNNVGESFKRFQLMIMKHSIERPPKSVQIFMPSDVEPILDYALNTYFRNYNLYSYVFAVQTLLTIRQTGADGVELPYVPLPLQQGKIVTSPDGDANQ